MKTLCLLLCLASFGAVTHAQNLLKNPSFEDVGPSPDTAANWYRWGDWMNREAAWTPTHSGTSMIGYHHWQVTSEKNSGMWQDVTGVQPGQKFKFSVFVSADTPNATDSSAASVELRLEAIHNGHEELIESATTPVADLQKTPGWHELSVTGTTPENNIRVLVVVTPALSAPRGGAIKIDDAELEAVK